MTITEEELAKWETRAIVDPHWDAASSEIYLLIAEVRRQRKTNEGGGCDFTDQGRGDCEHYVGLPGRSIPGQHDGPDDTVDAYGKPNDWCWSCWKSHRMSKMEAKIEEQAKRIAEAEHTLIMSEAHMDELTAGKSVI